ncbi:GNAT family N-acetyltransferase [Legionella worsleiensis]|uniref:Multifunctional nucleotidyltransferase/glutamate rich protein GrpB/ribosomal protein alanine acetyltransferase n=1 Tax=Legionella worsleiensis TaxID=45076 RepID=A0A0W1AKK7_9GAMM|nr:GNAT family N-acetyltransferase [Legionella worsleiensis]KTD81826.1 multifunctional nucleotidyltransferase/glutamate rich protein GrpB/ribosomal protein alanine acetyltransferase [Legionella worsleiensis]STY31020.1 nucleotidyltransferase PLUS glutamate rich protein GrpB PLUS ribosomal protein alanine acetyltransferase [Legionella worsleiensis]
MSIFLETKRLVLRAPELSDLDELVTLRSDFEVMKYTGEGGAQTKEQVEDYLNFALSYQKKHGMGFYLVFEKESGSFVGEAGLFHLLFDDTQPEIEVGYHLHKKFWGKGYATELTKTLVHWGFQHLLINKLVAATYPNQTASQKVLQKSGFNFRGKKQTSDGMELFWYEIYKSDGVETTHLQLHRPTAADALLLRALWQDKQVRQFLGGVVSNELIDEKIVSLQRHWDQHGFGQWSVIDKKQEQVIGICGLHHSEDGIELSYMFFPASWGKGLAKEATCANLDYGFNQLNLDKVIAITQEANTNSCCLLESIGMRAIDRFRRFDTVQLLYEITKNEYTR